MSGRSEQSLASEAARWRKSCQEARSALRDANRQLLGIYLRERLADPGDFEVYVDPGSVVDHSGRIVWEPLFVLADEAGGHWPDTARCSAVALVADAKAVPPTIGVQLLADIRTVFGDVEHVTTEQLLEHLTGIEESPWGDIRGKALDARGLSRRLARYEIKPRNVRVADRVVKGYTRGDFVDAWARYLPVVAVPLTHSSRREREEKEGQVDAISEPIPLPPDSSATSATPLHGLFDDSGDGTICSVCGQALLSPASIAAGICAKVDDPHKTARAAAKPPASDRSI